MLPSLSFELLPRDTCPTKFAKALRQLTIGYYNLIESYRKSIQLKTRILFQAMMSWLLSCLPFRKSSRPLPAVVLTDEVVPVHLFDDTSALRSINMVWTFRFEEVLDPEKLNQSLSQLFQMEGWRKLGGRYRCRVRQCALHLHDTSNRSTR